MKRIEFTKMHGLGNDFIMINDLNNEYVNKEEKFAKKLCYRNFGVGADGVIFVRKSKEAHIQMVIYNADGSYAEMCGNGIRCFAKYVYDKNICRENPMKIESGDGIKEAVLYEENGKAQSVQINMGTYSLYPEKVPVLSKDEVIDKEIEIDGEKIRVTSMLMGVPHTMVFGELDNIDVELGKVIEHMNMFPKKTNVNFCEVVSKEEIKVKTWERGAGATMACGTGSCASVIAANILGLTGNKVQVQVPGGKMVVEIKEDGIFMTGPAEISFEGYLFN